jgi:4-diphosphocytidyl-2-C-methyl-D-erythritol kinase
MIYNRIKSYAKINLALNVVGKTSLLHKIESIIAFVDLHDTIMIRRIKSKNHEISFFGKFSKNIIQDNSVVNLLKILEKKKLLNNQKFQIKINKKETIKISKLVGSDVFLGINSTNSILTSQNKIRYFKKCKKFHTLIVKPNFGCSTKEIYAKVRKFNKPIIKLPNKNMFNLNYLKKMSNSLEQIALSEYPKLRSIKFYLEGLSKQVFVRMTGSGSALVAYFESRERCLNAKKMFNKKYKNYWCIVSKTI